MRSQRSGTPSSSLVELSVERIGAQGDGIAHFAGEPVFLPFTVAGDRVRARLGARRGGGRDGRVVERLVSGPGRADPPCPHFGDCGGCTLQHVEWAAYRAIKLSALGSALERAGIDPVIIEPLVFVPPARRRARLGLMRPHDSYLAPRIGFRPRFRHDLVDITECLVLEPPLFAVVGELRQLVHKVLEPGGTAEAVLSCTDSGVDLLIEAIERPDVSALEALARAAAGRQGISVERRDLARNPFPPERLSRYAAAVFDPPRAGALRQAEALAGSALDTIVAISCNPATFARDAAKLIAGGFRLERLTPVDQFVWTPHLEMVAVFRR